MTADAPRVWIKASASNGADNCVEMAPGSNGGVDVRDSKNKTGPVLSYNRAEFAAWLDGAKNGEFDHLAI